MFVQMKISGKDNFGLHGLVWAQVASEKGRLFGISIRGFIFEVDFTKLNIKNIRDTNGGAAWCLAADPLDTLLAVGGDDGAVRLFRYAAGALEYVRTQPTVGCRVASVAFHPLQPKLFIGCADGTIRCVDKVCYFSLYISYTTILLINQTLYKEIRNCYPSSRW